MFFQVLPFEPLYFQFKRWESLKNAAYLVAEPEGGDDRKGCVDPCAGYAGEFIEAEYESSEDCKGGVQAEKGSETDEHANGKTGGNVPGVTVEGKYLLPPFFPFFPVQQLILGICRLIEGSQSKSTMRLCQRIPT